MLSLLLACSSLQPAPPETSLQRPLAETTETTEATLTKTDDRATMTNKEALRKCAELCALNKKAEGAGELISASLRDQLLISTLIEQDCQRECEDPSTKDQGLKKEAGQMTITGLSTPESVLYDAKLDRYLISNINGDPAAKDGNGFISLRTSAGKLSTWISSTETAKLHAPKGMGIQGNKLYVSDIDVVHVYDSRSGDFLYDVPIVGSKFLNDVVATETDIYVSDSTTGQIHSIHPEGKTQPEFADSLLPELGKINGLARKGLYLYVTSDQHLMRYHIAKKQLQKIDLGTGQLDGIALAIDDSAYVSSWAAGAIYKVSNLNQDPVVEIIVEELDSPADIGLDSKRNRLLIPLFNQDEVLLLEVPR